MSRDASKNVGDPGPEFDVVEDLCRRCNCCDTEWLECSNCGGDGVVGHDCGEDSCCCLEPEDNVPCDQCRGEGGFLLCGGRCDEAGKHASPVAAESDGSAGSGTAQKECFLCKRDFVDGEEVDFADPKAAPPSQAELMKAAFTPDRSADRPRLAHAVCVEVAKAAALVGAQVLTRRVTHVLDIASTLDWSRERLWQEIEKAVEDFKT